MITADKDLEVLRKEQKDLSDYTTKVGILSLTVLIILVVSFARACKKINGEEVKTSLCRIDKIIEQTKSNNETEERNVSYVFDLFSNDNDKCEINCTNPLPTPMMSPSPYVAPSTAASPKFPANVPARTATPGPGEVSAFAQELKRKGLLACKKSIENSLEDSAQKWFGVKAPIPGVEITIDLRYWIFGFPILFFLSGIYLHILRKKISILGMLGSYRVRPGRDVTQVDRLLFGGDPPQKRTPFTKFPSGLEAVLFISAYLFLPAYLIYVGAPFWGHWESSSILGIVLVLLTLGFYAISYAHFATQRLDRQLVSLTKESPTRNLINSVLGLSKCIINWLRTRIPQKLTLSTGSLLVMLTLFLAMSQESCGDTRHTGLDIARGVRGAKWFTADNILGVNSVYNRIAQIVYIISILLAVATIVVAFIRKVQGARIVRLLAILTFLIFSFSLIDFSLNVPLFSNWFIPAKLLFWAVPVFLWIRYRLFARNPEGWVSIRAVIFVLYTPILLLAFLVVGKRLDLPGLSVFLAGLILLTLGYMQETQLRTAQ